MERILAVEPLAKPELAILTGKRAEPRVAFVSLLEAGLLKPGSVLYDKKREHAAIVRADGTIVVDGEAGSIHMMGRKVQNSASCNGWTFWYVEKEGRLVLIDELRVAIREQMAKSGV